MSNLETNFRDLAHAGLRLFPQLLEGAEQRHIEMLDHAKASGAQLLIEFGPLPEFAWARFVLVEREGARHNLGAVAVNTPTLM